MSISPPTVEQLYECAQTLSDSPKNKISEVTYFVIVTKYVLNH